MTSPVYDLDRAARAAGFGNDLTCGRAAAAIAIRTAGALRREGRVDAFEPETLSAWADLFDADPDDPAWLAAASNSLAVMVLDLGAQERELLPARAVEP